ncbi:hypothetical protein KUCAC02_025450 [Chaenocephalus aceratus]|uniref:Uncharacterized protein n=1 Tax=Chaenocephalus aceratus TaxID=36190 RepID=A0ACB9VVB7_CHAAC|nr:hypothetical protein KUCAC02_025450 [Chaenocephalus aceratus]
MDGKEDGVAAMAATDQGFDPAAYLQYNSTPPRADFENNDSVLLWKMGCLHRAFTEGDVSGELLVDIGSGPTLVNRQELKRWLKNAEDSALDWTPFLKHTCKLEGRQPSAWTEKAARLRSVVSDVLYVDVHIPQPLDPGALPPAGADCLVSCFCLEASSPDLAAFNRALGHMKVLLRSGGHLLLI